MKTILQLRCHMSASASTSQFFAMSRQAQPHYFDMQSDFYGHFYKGFITSMMTAGCSRSYNHRATGA